MCIDTKAESDIQMYTPGLTRVLLSTPTTPDDTCQTLYTDGLKIGYNPSYWEALEPQYRLGAWVHELLHIVLAHPLRRGNRDPERWNCAADYELNPYVADTGYALHPSWLYDAKYAGMSAEEIYEILPKGLSQKCQCRLDDQAHADGTPLTPQEIDERRALADAVAAAIRWGQLPGSLARALDKMVAPRRSCAGIIASWLERVASDEETYAPPDRRCHYLPGYEEVEQGKIAVIVDTSGSIGEKELDVFASEALGVLLQAGEIVVIAADASVQSIVTVASKAEFLSALRGIKGGGGTDFRPGLAAAEKMDNVCGAVYLTDGEGTYPARCTLPVLWALTAEDAPPFGAVVKLKE